MFWTMADTGPPTSMAAHHPPITQGSILYTEARVTVPCGRTDHNTPLFKSLQGLPWHVKYHHHFITMTYSLGRQSSPPALGWKVGGEAWVEIQNLRAHSRLDEPEAASISH